MKIKYHQQHNNRRRFSRIILSIGVLFILSLTIALSGNLQYLTKYIYASALSSITNITDSTKTITNTLKPKSALLRENQELRTQLQELKILSLYNQSLTIENNNLKAQINSAVGNVYNPDKSVAVLARIIDYKSIPYGTILAKINTLVQVKPGDIVRFGKLAIGTVHSVDGKYILIKLFTASGNTHSVFVGNHMATFTGMSNNTGRIVISRNTLISKGDVVSLPSAGGLIIGYIEEIEHNLQDSTQTLLVRAPIRISQLQFISIDND
jgi:cell shape-determining protein MreC